MNTDNCLEIAGIPFSALTLICAVLIPVLCALAVFLCLRKAPISRKATVYFVLSPIYVVLTVFVFCDITEYITKTLEDRSVFYPAVVGFLAALTIGIIYLSFASLICGAGILRRSGAVVNAVFTLLCLVLCAYLTVVTFRYYRGLPYAEAKEIRVLALSEIIPSVASVFPWSESIGVGITAAAIFVLFLIVYFICFIAVSDNDYVKARIAEETAESEEKDKKAEAAERRAALRRGCSDEDKCCAYCEHARQLNGDRANALCDFNGIVAAGFVCKNFIYDPLKRAPGSFRGFAEDESVGSETDTEENSFDKE